MAMIKSALELALERTKDLHVDEKALKANAVKVEGRKAAGKILEDGMAAELGTAVRAAAPEFREVFRKAAYDVLAAQIQLPNAAFSPEKLASIGAGLGALALSAPLQGAHGAQGADRKVTSLIQQISAFLSKYLEDLKKVEQAIRTQWAPKLRDKERQMAARMGQDVRLDPMQDPEFAAFYKQNVENLRTSYSDALEKAKQDLAALCGFAPEQEG
ncbi:MAG: hypothetical protein NT061_01285 [Spirochaetes bacterium]|nr:hypothetical protein [Spirochaetota bacterium]